LDCPAWQLVVRVLQNGKAAANLFLPKKSCAGADSIGRMFGSVQVVEVVLLAACERRLGSLYVNYTHVQTYFR